MTCDHKSLACIQPDGVIYFRLLRAEHSGSPMWATTSPSPRRFRLTIRKEDRPMSTAKDWKWVATNSPVANSRTDDIWFFDEKAGWLVNSNGQVSQTLDGGDTWDVKKFIDPNSKAFPYLRCMGWAAEDRLCLRMTAND